MPTKREIEAVEQEIEESRRRSASFYYVDVPKLERMGIAQFRTTPGDNFIRILPPKEEGFYGKRVYVHPNIDERGNVLLCPKGTFDKPCPICEALAEIRKKNSDDERLSVLPIKRYLFFVVDVRSKSTEEEGIKWYDAPSVVKDNIVGLSKDKRTGEVIVVSDPEEGRDIEFTRTGTGLNTRYQNFKLVDNNPIPDEWKDVPSFDEVLLIPSEEDLQRVADSLLGKPTRRSSDESDSGPDEVDDGPEVDDVGKEAPAPVRRVRRSRDDSEGSEFGSSDRERIRQKIEEIKAKRRMSNDERGRN
ncbi:MAG: hypothetical protein ACTSP1_15820 [Candidatus Freyarchaeota archaeon]